MYRVIKKAVSEETIDKIMTAIKDLPEIEKNYLPFKPQPEKTWMISPYGSVEEIIETHRRTVKLNYTEFSELKAEIAKAVNRMFGRCEIDFGATYEYTTNTFMVTKYLPGSFFEPHVDVNFSTTTGITNDGTSYAKDFDMADYQAFLYSTSVENPNYSLIVLLNDEFTGGRLSIHGQDVNLEKGDIAIFSQLDIHALSKIESGMRYVVLSRFKILNGI